MNELLARQRSSRYTCANLAAEAWERETGRDIGRLLGIDLSGSPTVRDHGILVRVPAPFSPCIVLFQRGRLDVHVGVFLRGRVLHLTERGPMRQLLSIASLGFTSVRFYAARPTDH
jgi:hypothetical protein